MPKSKSTVAELERVKREREAIQAQQDALKALESELRQRLAAERAQVIVDAFAAANVGEIEKRDATRLAREIARVGIAQVLDLIDKPAGLKGAGAGGSPASEKAQAEPPSAVKLVDQSGSANDEENGSAKGAEVELAA